MTKEDFEWWNDVTYKVLARAARRCWKRRIVKADKSKSPWRDEECWTLKEEWRKEKREGHEDDFQNQRGLEPAAQLVEQIQAMLQGQIIEAGKEFLGSIRTGPITVGEGLLGTKPGKGHETIWQTMLSPRECGISRNICRGESPKWTRISKPHLRQIG